MSNSLNNLAQTVSDDVILDPYFRRVNGFQSNNLVYKLLLNREQKKFEDEQIYLMAESFKILDELIYSLFKFNQFENDLTLWVSHSGLMDVLIEGLAFGSKIPIKLFQLIQKLRNSKEIMYDEEIRDFLKLNNHVKLNMIKEFIKLNNSSFTEFENNLLNTFPFNKHMLKYTLLNLSNLINYLLKFPNWKVFDFASCINSDQIIQKNEDQILNLSKPKIKVVFTCGNFFK